MRGARGIQRIARGAGVAAVALATLLAAVAAPDIDGDAAVPTREVAVSIDLRDRGPRVPQRFLGLSFELSSLAQIADYADHGDFVTMLRSLGPGVLRFGGVTADTRVAWTDAASPLPAWASSALTVEDLQRLRDLAQRSGWSVLLTVGLAHYEPIAAAREVAAAKHALGHWLAGVEIGNEPDAYAHHGLRSEPWTATQYDEEVAAYRELIAQVAPGVPLVGPDVSGSHVFPTWGREEALEERPGLLTGHHYPLGCHDLPPPTIEGLLSPEVRLEEAASLRRYMAVARASTTPFRMDETNSVSCGGVAGISNTFAAALWATNYTATAMGAGLAGMNFHGNPANCLGYSPVCAPDAASLAAGALIAQPEWYALLLSKELIGDRPLRIRAPTSSAPNLSVVALLGRHGGLAVVVVDEEPPEAGPVMLKLRVGSGFASGRILSLTAPSPASTTGVSLGGRVVNSDGSWTAPSALPRATNREGALTLEASPGSAMLVTVAPRGSTRRRGVRRPGRARRR